MANGISTQPLVKEEAAGMLSGLWRILFPDPERFNALALTIETLKKSERGEGVHEYENFEEYLKEVHG